MKNNTNYNPMLVVIGCIAAIVVLLAVFPGTYYMNHVKNHQQPQPQMVTDTDVRNSTSVRI